VRDDVFFWRESPGPITSTIGGGAIAADDDGGLWVADNGNRRYRTREEEEGLFSVWLVLYSSQAYFSSSFLTESCKLSRSVQCNNNDIMFSSLPLPNRCCCACVLLSCCSSVDPNHM
jgi:hypothetical protein